MCLRKYLLTVYVRTYFMRTKNYKPDHVHLYKSALQIKLTCETVTEFFMQFIF